MWPLKGWRPCRLLLRRCGRRPWDRPHPRSPGGGRARSGTGPSPPPTASLKAAEGERAPATQSAMLEPYESTGRLLEEPPGEAARATLRRAEEGGVEGQREPSHDALINSDPSPAQLFAAAELRLQQNALPALHFVITNFTPVTLLLQFSLKYPRPLCISQPQGVPQPDPRRPTPLPHTCHLYRSLLASPVLL